MINYYHYETRFNSEFFLSLLLLLLINPNDDYDDYDECRTDMKTFKQTECVCV